MFKLFIVLLCISLASWAGMTIYNDPGYLLVSYSNYSLEAPLWLGFSVFIVFLFILYFVLKSLGVIINLKSNFLSSYRESRRKKAVEKTKLGVEYYFCRNWSRAERELLNSVNNSEIPLLNYVLAAKAAQEMGNEVRRDKYLKMAYNNLPEYRNIINLTEASLNLHQGAFKHSLNILNNLSSNSENYESVLFLLKNAYLQLEDWNKLVQILPDLKKYKVVKDEEFISLGREVYTNLLQDMSNNSDLQELDKLWEEIPNEFVLDPQIVYLYAKLLLVLGKHNEASDIVVSSLRSEWSNKLAVLYGYIITDDTKGQIRQAQEWLESNPDDPYILFSLGKLYLTVSDYASARDYLQKSLALMESIEACNELGLLYDCLGETSTSLEYYKRGATLLNPASSLAREKLISISDLSLSDNDDIGKLE